METFKWKKSQIVLLIQAMILSFAAFILIMQYMRTPDLKISIMDWQSQYINYNMGWYIDEDIVQTSNTIDMIYGPYAKLKRGTYSIKVEYECDENQGCLAYAHSGMDEYIKTELEVLPKDKTCVLYDVTLTRDINFFEVVIRYNGKGILKISNIDIKPTAVGKKKIILWIFFIFLVLDISVYFCIYHRKLILFILLFLILIFGIGKMLAGARKTSWVEMEEVRYTLEEMLQHQSLQAHSYGIGEVWINVLVK